MKNKALKDLGKQKNIIKIIVWILCAFLLAAICAYLFPVVLRLKDPDVRDEVRVFITDRGAVGALIMLGIQLVQVILSIIPGEPVEVLFGFVYGPWLGALLCLAGMMLGSFSVFCFIKALGRNFMERTEQSEKYRKLKFLKDPKKRDILIFILFLLPGTPKDTLTYFAPFTKIDLGKFLFLSTLGRIPSVISSTFAGESIFTGDYVGSIFIFVITGAIGILGIFLYNFLLSKHSSSKITSDTEDKEND